MKKAVLIVVSMFFGLTVFAQDTIIPAAPGVIYGKALTADEAVNIDALNATLSKDSAYTGKITGTVVEVCKKKGCFIKLEQANGSPVMVQFTDYAYFMPQNIVGKTVVVEGKARVKKTSVEKLKHFAADAGKSASEIAMITEPKKDIAIMADGVLVVK
ncbi:DUF4920 domain-containing protein [Mucilaginibacter pallidiroseus]|uniref:DUF4920 domain-containing protein n=1 Tax=Mucilaginibacter pallidiroseus TaxID=2599295 RepID=A0A563UKB0_9SPHI|nr:DUF4920 domain-containing protein [Mucilaginibacter pallidiroseus]TWR31706.1 DUF4920 domain-containing protein [Mucilaginibacter pallidiroseus]